MASPIGNKRNIKIFILYLMENIAYPLDYATVNDIVMQTDYVGYLDFAETFHELIEGGLITVVEPAESVPKAEPAEHGKPDEKAKSDKNEKSGETGRERYLVSPRGRIVAQELHSAILPSILDQSLSCALRFLDFRRRGIRAESELSKREGGACLLSLRLLEKESVIFETSLLLDSLTRAERMREKFRDHPEKIYKGVLALLSGNVDFLMQDSGKKET